MYRLSLERSDLSMPIILCYAVLSCSVMSNSLQCHGLQPTRLLCSRGFSRQEYWSGLPALLQGIFPTQGIELSSPTLQMNSLPSEPRILFVGIPQISTCLLKFTKFKVNFFILLRMFYFQSHLPISLVNMLWFIFYSLH